MRILELESLIAFNRTEGSKSSFSTNPARRKRRKARTGLIAGAIAAAALIGGQALAQAVKAPPDVSATSVFVVNADTGQVLYARMKTKFPGS